MKRDLTIGNKINNWTVVSLDTTSYKSQVTLKCGCGKLSTVDVRTVNRSTFSKSCRGCSQIKRRDDGDRVYNVGDILMNLEIIKIHSGKSVSYEVKCLKCGYHYHTGHSILNKKKNGKGLDCCHNCFNVGMKSKKKFTYCTEHISLTYYKKLERSADLRGIYFNVSPEYLESIYDGFCYVSGLPIEIGTHSNTKGKSSLGTSSLDRIDSNKGYVEGNVGWCFKKINVMKHTSKLDEFIKMCEIISDFNKNKIK